MYITCELKCILPVSKSVYFIWVAKVLYRSQTDNEARMGALADPSLGAHANLLEMLSRLIFLMTRE